MRLKASPALKGLRDQCVQAHLPVIQNQIHTVASHLTVDTETLPSRPRWSRHWPSALQKYC